jgi:hypothetical protein
MPPMYCAAPTGRRRRSETNITGIKKCDRTPTRRSLFRVAFCGESHRAKSGQYSCWSADRAPRTCIKRLTLRRKAAASESSRRYSPGAQFGCGEPDWEESKRVREYPQVRTQGVPKGWVIFSRSSSSSSSSPALAEEGCVRMGCHASGCLPQAFRPS